MHNCRCVMSQPRYFKVDACQDCALCKKNPKKPRGFNQLASITKCRPRRHPQFHHVLEYHILTVSHWITRSSNTKTDSAAAEFNIPTKNCVGLGAVRVQQSLEREPNCWHVDHSGRKKERTNNQEIEKIISHSLMNFAAASSSDPHLMDSHHAHVCVTELRFEQKNRLPTLKRTVLTTAKTLDHHHLASGRRKMRCGAKHNILCQGLAYMVTWLPIR